MKFGFIIPHGDVHTISELAQRVEAAGWDDAGFYKVGEAMDSKTRAKLLDESPFDIIWEGRTPGDDRETSVAIVRRWEEAGASWWMEAMWESDVTMEDIRKRIEQGPPRGE